MTLLYLPQATGGDVGDGYGGEAFELDDDVAVLLDALDDTLDASEVALGDDDTASYLVEVVAMVKKHDAVVLNGSHTHEVLHLGIGDSEQAVNRTLGKAAGDVTQRLQLTTGGLELGYLSTAAPDKDEVMDGRNQQALLVTVAGVYKFIVHGQEVLYLETVQILLDLDLTPVGDAHGVPRGYSV